MVGDIIGPEDARWARTLAQAGHDIYHLPGYLQFAATHEGGRPAALYAESGDQRLLAPVVLREIPEALRLDADQLDAVSPYGYSGPVVTRGTDDATMTALLGVAAEAARAAGVVCGFFRMHPLLPLSRGPMTAAGDVVAHGQTVHIPLLEGVDAARAGIRQGHRHDIKKLRRAGFSAHVNRWDDFDEFVRIYLATMSRVAADDYYLFPDGYFQGLRSALGDSLSLVTVHGPHGSVAAGGLFSAHQGLAQYLFSGTDAEFLRQAPTKLMIDEAIAWAAGKGCDVLHLGGGVGGAEDSLFRFKSGFSKRRSDFESLRLVWDAAAYEQLAGRWMESRGVADRPAFFPTYRAPAPVGAAASEPSDNR